MLKSTVIGAVLAAALVTGCATHPATVAANDPQCIRDTGTRIQSPDRKCLDLPGSSYSQRDIQSTGQIDTGAALKQLDPRLQ